jgi:hypothetical protein
MKKGLVIFLLVAGLLGAALYWLNEQFFAPGERVFAQLPHVHVGMRTAEVRALLGPPDTTYTWSEAPYPHILQYEMGPLAPDDVRMVVTHDTVTAITYAQ